MILPSKKLAMIASLVGGLAYVSQHYTIDGLRGLRIEPRSRSSSEIDKVTAFPTSSTQWPFRNHNDSQKAIGEEGADSSWFPDIGKSVAAITSSPGLTPTNQNVSLTKPTNFIPPVSSLRAPTLKVASFNLQRFGHHKAENPFVAETVIRIIKQFDIVALQEICTQQQDLIAMIVDRVNETGYRYDYLIGPRVGRGEISEQFAFIFNTDSIETDRDQLYTVDDPDSLIVCDPLVGWFRSKKADQKSAFTFSLVNIHCVPERASAEVRLLPELVRSIHRDGRNEDDVILVGDFGTDALTLVFLKQQGFTTVLNGIPTLVSGSQMTDNIVLTNKATDEYIGRSGTLDFLRKSNLSMEQALQVSDHLPIWAEFSIVEGGAYKD